MLGNDRKLRIAVKSLDDMRARFGEALQRGGMFVREDRPPAVGTEIVLEFLLPTGGLLSRIGARVAHARPADVAGQATAGMALQFQSLDARAEQIAKRTPGSEPEAATGAPRVDELKDAPSGAGGPILGIDLGTTNSCVAVVEHGSPRVLSTGPGNETTPSVVFVGADKKVVIGQKAIERMVLEPQRGIYGAKRFIGRPFASREVRTFGHFFHYELAEDQNGYSAIKIDGNILPLEWVSACILAQLKHTAKLALGREVSRAVITVPAYFGEKQRQAVREAGKLAGLEVERVLSEPTAAAVAFGYGRGLNKRILIYDLGGGTFDASILSVQGDRMEVLATDGDPFLGGSDFDNRLTEFILGSIQRSHGVDLRQDRVSVQRVRFAAEAAKKALSESHLARVLLPFLTQTANGPINVDLSIEAELLEGLTEDLVTRTLGIVDNVLKLAGLKATDIDDVVLVGGQSRSPVVARRLQERFGKKPSRGIHPDHAVALGAAIVAAAAYGSPAERADVELTDRLAASIRLQRSEDQPTEVILPRGTPLPAEKEFEIETAGTKTKEYIAALYRGEAAAGAENELLGQVRLPASLALAISKTKAKIKLAVSADGMLAVSMHHPLTDEVQELRVALTARENAAAMQLVEADLIMSA